MFVLDAQLKQDSYVIGKLSLCQIRLMNNQYYPWLILIPEIENITELFELSLEQQTDLMHEITLSSKIMNKIFQPDKINIAALGNIVKQLHIHIVARYKNDALWPDPVWGKNNLSAKYDEYGYIANKIINGFNNEIGFTEMSKLG